MQVVRPGEGEVVGNAPDRRVEILCDHDAVHVTWSRFGAGRDGANLHVHREHTDMFFVLEGDLTLRLGPEGREVTIPAGELARLPRLVVHGFRNASDGEVRYLNLHAPGRGFATFMRSIRDGAPRSYDQFDPPEDGGRPTSEAVIGERATPSEDGGVRTTVLADVEGLHVAEVELADGAGHAAPAGGLVCRYVLDGAVEADGAALPTGTWLHTEDASTVRATGAARLLTLRVATG